MNLITAFLSWVFDPQPAQSQRDRDEKYLAKSVDLGDLERRMRALDQRRPLNRY